MSLLDDCRANVPSEIVTPPPSKRTRTDSPSSSAKRRRTPASQVAGSPSTRTRSSARKAENIIALDSDDDDEKDDSIQIVEPERPSPDNDDDPFADEEEEDEFAEYIRKAEAEKRKLGGPSAHTGGSSSRDTPAKGTKVDLFVQSAIPGSTHCLMKVFLESPLVLVRNAWVEAQRRHEVDIGVTDPADLVLTWRRSRVYNYSTLHSLGIRPMGDGIVVTTAAAGGAGDGTSGLSSAHPARVHMEVWTPDMFKQWEEERERQRRREEDEEQDDDEDEAGGRDAQEEEQEQAKFKVVLKARDLDDLKLTVRPETTAGTLVKAFRSARGLGAEAAVSLWFDGDMLEEEGTMDEAEIDDMDTIEVHVR